MTGEIDIQNMPKSRDQIYQRNQKIRAESKPKVGDDIRRVLELALHGSFVQKVVTTKGNNTAIVLLPELCQHVEALLRMGTPLTAHYDTTFPPGPFYISAMSLKHPFIMRNNVNRNSPIFPVGIVVHQNRIERAHEDFFEELLGWIPSFNSEAVTIVSDREGGIRNAIDSKLGNCYVAYCHRHIIEVNTQTRQFVYLFANETDDEV